MGVLLTGCDTKPAEMACPTSPLTQEVVAESSISKDELSFHVLKHPQFTGVIFPAEAKGAGLSGRKGDPGFWTPSNENIIEAETTLRQALEGKLRSALQRSDDPRNAEIIPAGLCHYNRQYVGTLRDGKKHIHVNFFRSEEFLPYEGMTWSGASTWETQAIIAYGGGANFFQASYDMTARSWEWVEVNSLR
jgi:hypothetical protein